MDFDSSLDSIIKSKRKAPSHNNRYRHASSTIRSSRSPSLAYSLSPYAMSHHLSRYEREHHDLRARISQPNTKQRHSRGMPDLRERIGRQQSRPSNGSGGISTSNLPNRQRMHQQLQQQDNGFESNSDGDNDSEIRRDGHSIIITKPVYRNDSSSSTTTSSSGSGHRKNSQADSTSIVITKAVKHQHQSPPPPTSYSSQHYIENDQEYQLKSVSPSPAPPPPPLSLPPLTGDTDRLLFQQYIEEQQQEQQRMREQMEQQMQQQLKAQNEQILELQRLVTSQQQALSQYAQFGYGSNSNNRVSPSNTVLLSNLDPTATSSDVQAVCDRFGLVIRCDVARDTQGRSCGEAEVEFLDHDSALNCIAKFDNELVDDRIIRATLRQPPMQHNMRSVIAPTRSGYRTTSQVLYTDK